MNIDIKNIQSILTHPRKGSEKVWRKQVVDELVDLFSLLAKEFDDKEKNNFMKAVGDTIDTSIIDPQNEAKQVLMDKTILGINDFCDSVKSVITEGEKNIHDILLGIDREPEVSTYQQLLERIMNTPEDGYGDGVMKYTFMKILYDHEESNDLKIQHLKAMCEKGTGGLADVYQLIRELEKVVRYDDEKS